jgi:hypothetical protein
MCASGGTGRLAGFRCQCSQGRAGSNPASRTNPIGENFSDGNPFGVIYMDADGKTQYARVVELADSLDSGSSARKGMRVQVPPRAPKKD